MPEMFGAPTGMSRAEENIRENKLAELSLAKGSVELEVARTKLEQNKRMLSFMSQSMQSPSAQNFDMADSMSQLATMALKSGMPEEARQYAEASATLRRTTSQIDIAQFNQKMKHLELLSNLMANVHDERSWRQANALFKMQTGKDTPFAQQPYNPETVANLQRSFMTAKDQALTNAAKARERASNSASKEREARLPLIRAQVEESRARTRKLEKAGATQILPKAGDVKMIRDLIINEYGAGVMPEEASVLAQPVAENMMKILKDSNLSKSQAAYRAFQEAKDTGHFGGLRPRIHMSGTKENPKDIPITKDGKADPTKLRVNLYYKGVGKYAGKTLLWNGRGFQEAPPVDENLSDVTDEEESEDADEAAEDEDREEETGGAYSSDDYANPDDYDPDDYVGAQ